MRTSWKCTMFRFLPYCLILWKINSGSTQKVNFFPVNSCTDIKLKDIPVDVFQSCSETDKTIHCLPDENDNLGLSCFAVTWISEGKCPSYNSYQGNMDEKDCSGDRNDECSGVLYKSPLSVRYIGCYVKEKLSTETSTSKLTTTTITDRSTVVTRDNPSTTGSRNGTNQRQTCTNCDVCDSGHVSIEAFGAVLAFLLLALTIIAGAIFVMRSNCFCPYKERCFKVLRVQRRQNDSKAQDTNQKQTQVKLLQNGAI